MRSGVKEQLPVIEQDFAAGTLLQNIARGPFHEDDFVRQSLVGAQFQFVAIDDCQQGLLRNDVGLAVGYTEAEPRQ